MIAAKPNTEAESALTITTSWIFLDSLYFLTSFPQELAFNNFYVFCLYFIPSYSSLCFIFLLLLCCFVIHCTQGIIILPFCQLVSVFSSLPKLIEFGNIILTIYTVLLVQVFHFLIFLHFFFEDNIHQTPKSKLLIAIRSESRLEEHHCILCLKLGL